MKRLIAAMVAASCIGCASAANDAIDMIDATVAGLSEVEPLYQTAIDELTERLEGATTTCMEGRKAPFRETILWDEPRNENVLLECVEAEASGRDIIRAISARHSWTTRDMRERIAERLRSAITERDDSAIERLLDSHPDRDSLWRELYARTIEAQMAGGRPTIPTTFTSITDIAEGGINEQEGEFETVLETLDALSARIDVMRARAAAAQRD